MFVRCMGVWHSRYSISAPFLSVSVLNFHSVSWIKRGKLVQIIHSLDVVGLETICNATVRRIWYLLL